MTRKRMLILAVVAGLFLHLHTATAYVGAASKLDDLYRLAVRSSSLKGVSRESFNTLVRAGKLTKLAPVIRSLPKEDRLAVMLEIAEQRQLVRTTQLPGLAARYKAVEKGDQLLFETIAFGDSKLVRLAPKYGHELVSIERYRKGAGIQIIDDLGDEGWKIAKKLPNAQAARLAGHSESLGALHALTKSKVLDAVADYPAKALKFLDDNPGILYKSAGVTAFLVFVENVSQPTSTTITQPDGTVIKSTESWLSKVSTAVSAPIYWVFWTLLAGLIGWLGIQLWGSWKKKQREISKTNEETG